MIRVIVNGDDFGMRDEISKGILVAHKAGIMTSCSIMGNCDNFPAVSELLKDATQLGKGAHLNIFSGPPLSPLTRSSALVNGSTFHGTISGLVRALLVTSTSAIEREFDTQITRLLSAGLELDHIDTHIHVGHFPRARTALQSVSNRYRLPIRSRIRDPLLHVIRAPIHRCMTSMLLHVTSFGARDRPWHPETIGVACAGNLHTQALCELLAAIPDGTFEIVCHPSNANATNTGEARRRFYRGLAELEALTSDAATEVIRARQIALCRWSDVATC